MTNIQLQYLQHLESVRHNQAMEGDAAAQTQIKGDALAETARSNQAREAETYRSNQAHETEMNRSNLAREEEWLRRFEMDKDMNAHKRNMDYIHASTEVANAMSKAADVFVPW